MRTKLLILGLAALAAFAQTGAMAATSSTDFESFSTGTIDQQQGWSSSGAAGSGCATYDHAVADNTGASYSYPSFGSKSLRISNAVTSGCFSDQTFSSSLAEDAGEPTAAGDGWTGGPRRTRFVAQWDFASTTPDSAQDGLAVTASADRGDGARMSWVQMKDTTAGIEVNFFDYESGAVEQGCGDGSNFIFSNIASGLDRHKVHTIGMIMNFVPGPANDVVKVYVDGTLAHTGTSWEGYFRECEENPTRPVDSILFRTSSGAVTSTLGKGFLIDNLFLHSVDGTSLAADPYVQVGPLPSVKALVVKATLTDDLGAPVAGKSVAFAAGDTALCTATTTADGTASCEATTDGIVAVVLNQGYSASFAGDDVYLGSSGNAPLLSVAP